MNENSYIDVEIFPIYYHHCNSYIPSGWCRGEPITEAGKRRQMAKMLTLILTPITVLMAVSLYFVSENFTAKMESDKVGKSILKPAGLAM